MPLFSRVLHRLRGLLAAPSPSCRPSPPSRNRCRPSVEALETRALLSAAGVSAVLPRPDGMHAVAAPVLMQRRVGVYRVWAWDPIRTNHQWWLFYRGPSATLSLQIYRLLANSHLFLDIRRTLTRT
jgi:hypothetical protein